MTRSAFNILYSCFGVVGLTACTGQLVDSFRYQQQKELFTTNTEINTKVDMLWVVDNTPSMWPVQKKVREGFRQFASTYMKPHWDIRVAVISQDTYLAHRSFAGFLNGVGVTGSAQRYSRENGFQSSYLNPNSSANPRRSTPFVAPSWWGGAGISSNGTVTGGGIKLRHGVPEYGGANLAADVGPSNPSLYARLIPGRHDGPLTTLCWTSQSNPFFYGVSACHVRDRQHLYSGVDNCVEGGSGELDSAVQCVNTVMNNTVRTGKPIISTKPPTGVPADESWTEGLYRDFVVNLSGGVSGYPLEMHFNSIEQLIVDNESSPTAFFRPGALRVIVIVTDEDDQSTVLPSSGQITPDGQYTYSCPWKTVDGHTYRLQLCPLSDRVLPVATFKSRLDAFFKNLDATPSLPDPDPNYFVVTITPTTGQNLKNLHDDNDESSGNYGAVSSDYPTRLMAFSNLVGNGSLGLEITSQDYSPLLDQIGLRVVEKKARFKLRFRPSKKEDMLVRVVHADGRQTPISYADFEIDGYELVFTNNETLLGLTDTDRLLIDYQPGSLEE